MRARRLVVLATGQAGELLDPVLERRLGALDRCDLRGGLLDLGLVEDGRGLARGLLLERARLRQLLRDRRLEDELHHRQPEHEREHHGECGARDGQHDVRDATRPEALVDQPVDDADDARPDDSEPQDVLKRDIPPAASCDRDGEAGDHGHRRDDESLGVEEAPLARHERQNARVGAREPRPPQPGPARPARADVRFVRLHQTFVARAPPGTIDLNASIEPRTRRLAARRRRRPLWPAVSARRCALRGLWSPSPVTRFASATSVACASACPEPPSAVRAPAASAASSIVAEECSSRKRRSHRAATRGRRCGAFTAISAVSSSASSRLTRPISRAVVSATSRFPRSTARWKMALG